MTERRPALFRVVIGLNIDRHRQTDYRAIGRAQKILLEVWTCGF